MLSVCGVDDDSRIFCLGGHSRVDHLAEDLACGSSLIGLVLEHTHSGLELGKLCQLAMVLGLFEESASLIVLDLLFSSAPLGAGLKHVGRDAL